jgi:hypothetical protein
MTLEEATSRSITAAGAGDLDTLDQALAARAVAIAELQAAPPSEELASRVAAAIQSGEIIAAALRELKLRAGFESARLSQMLAALVCGLSFSSDPHVDYRG